MKKQTHKQMNINSVHDIFIKYLLQHLYEKRERSDSSPEFLSIKCKMKSSTWK